ncbi:hypothetical protein GGI22_001507 [Coemansia erecta]|nr:hypothetical protein GGI22_001507 [Coemansia erecta]
MVSAPGVDNMWTDVAVPFEAKSDAHTANDPVLRGQLLANFRDMAYDQPRRYSFGFGISKDGGVNVYLCTMDEIRFSSMGSLPCVGAPDIETRRLIQFLLLLYDQLPKDHYGFLVPNERGIIEPLCANSISGFDQSGQESILKTAQIVVKGCTAFNGRRHDNFGPRSWLYYAAIRSDEKTIHERAILKLNWCLARHCEATVHKTVKSIDVPYTPELLDSATIDLESIAGYTCEMLLIENGGKEVNDYCKDISPHNVQLIVDVFAGYSHALLVAAAGKDDIFILHRDISAGNLLVKDNKPYVIDWGCGLVAKRDESRSIPEGSLVGTAPYMSIRVLSQARFRSLLDDLESLFLVFSYCLWNKFGDHACKLGDKNFADLWNGALSANDTIDMRKNWLRDQRSFWDHMRISKDCPASLETFATGMYDLLFADGFVHVDHLGGDGHDPRITRFRAKDWARLFRDAADSAIRAGYPRFCHVDALCEYVRENPNCALISMDQPKLLETPTKRGHKRSLSNDGLEGLTSKIPKFSINQ